MDDLDKFCCQNKNCPQHGVRGGKNIHVRARYGQNKEHRLLYCLVCKEKFSERRGTVFFDSRLPEEKVVSILEYVVEGNRRQVGKRGLDLSIGHRLYLWPFRGLCTAFFEWLDEL